jgi:hypothetical protein
MQANFSKISMQADEDLRMVRLARGLRAVAATVIVGGIVIAAFDTAPPTERSTSRDATADPAGNSAISAPLVSPEPSTPASRKSEPALDRIERSMEHHSSAKTATAVSHLGRST